jgi:hypothetical protein
LCFVVPIATGVPRQVIEITDHSFSRPLVQEHTFSPQGAIFQHEELRLELPAVTHLSLTIVPNKSGSGVATLTAIRLFA